MIRSCSNQTRIDWSSLQIDREYASARDLPSLGKQSLIDRSPWNASSVQVNYVPIIGETLDGDCVAVFWGLEISWKARQIVSNDHRRSRYYGDAKAMSLSWGL